MNKSTLWALGFSFWVAAGTAAHSADKPVDFSAEQKQSAKEDEDQKAERAKGIKGKYQKIFLGSVHFLNDADPKLSPDVIGLFDTSDKDTKPNHHYQMKLEQQSKPLMDQLKKVDGKLVQITGKLRVIDANGDAKYLVVSSVEEAAPTPRIAERRSGSGL